MNEKAREGVFEPYYTTKPMGKGTGIGLALVHEIIGLDHRIIKRHNGFIYVHSQVDRGTTFTLFSRPMKRTDRCRSFKDHEFYKADEIT